MDFTRPKLRLPLVGVFTIGLLLMIYQGTDIYFGVKSNDTPTPRRRPPPPPSQPAQSQPCTCAPGAYLLKDAIPENQYEDVLQQRKKELKHYQARKASVLSKQLYASPNSPLQYPIQGFAVRPLQPTLIPGLGLYAKRRDSYKVVLMVSQGTLNTLNQTTGATVEGAGGSALTFESREPHVINQLLSIVTYTSKFYQINSGDLVTFQFEDYEAIFPIAIKQSQIPILYEMGTSIDSQVTIITKTFVRYKELKTLLDSIRQFYSSINIIIADDSFQPEKITGQNIQQFIMPPALGWFAGRNLAISQVTTKYFLWVDDDFLFTEKTKIEKFVEVMEANPYLDVVGGSVAGNRFYFSIFYEEGVESEGGCLHRKSGGHFHTLPGFPQCFLASGVVNFFLGRTDSMRKVGFDPRLKRVAHSEFFMDGFGSLMVASCSEVSVSHQKKIENSLYTKFRNPGDSDTAFKNKLLFSKNHLKCMKWG